MSNKQKLRNCEHCDNIISVRYFKTDKVYVCPLCGAVNALVGRQVLGKIVVMSPKTNCTLDLDDSSDNTVLFNTLDEEIRDALIILNENGWSIKFKGK
jgi:hypothetical protein